MPRSPNRPVWDVQSELIRAHQARLTDEGLYFGSVDGIPTDVLARVWEEDMDHICDFYEYLNMEVLRECGVPLDTGRVMF